MTMVPSGVTGVHIVGAALVAHSALRELGLYASTLALHRLYIGSVLALHRLYIGSALALHRLYIGSTSALHWLCIGST